MAEFLSQEEIDALLDICEEGEDLDYLQERPDLPDDVRKLFDQLNYAGVGTRYSTFERMNSDVENFDKALKDSYNTLRKLVQCKPLIKKVKENYPEMFI